MSNSNDLPDISDALRNLFEEKVYQCNPQMLFIKRFPEGNTELSGKYVRDDIQKLWTGFEWGYLACLNECKNQINALLSSALPVSTVTNPVFDMAVEDLGLSTRALGCLRAEGIGYIGELVRLTEQGLKMPNCGIATQKEIKQKLAERNLALGTDTTGWLPLQARRPELSAMEKLYNTRITNFGFNTHVMNCLINSTGIEYMGELIQFTGERLLKRTQNFGPIGLEQVIAVLKDHNLHLDTVLPGWEKPQS